MNERRHRWRHIGRQRRRIDLEHGDALRALGRARLLIGWDLDQQGVAILGDGGWYPELCVLSHSTRESKTLSHNSWYTTVTVL
jgi:hypothetical protein